MYEPARPSKTYSSVPPGGMASLVKVSLGTSIAWASLSRLENTTVSPQRTVTVAG